LATHKYLITGCSGGGKSSLVKALSNRGYSVAPEAGRLIVQEQFDSADDLATPVFFDRGFIEPLAHWRLRDAHAFSEVQSEIGDRRYNDPVFVAPPWPDIFGSDMECRHDFSEAVEEYQAICCTLNDLRYRQIEIPKLPVVDRAAFVLKSLNIAQNLFNDG
jgi:predicted ATPase